MESAALEGATMTRQKLKNAGGNGLIVFKRFSRVTDRLKFERRRINVSRAAEKGGSDE